MVLTLAVKEPAEVCCPCFADKSYMTLHTEQERGSDKHVLASLQSCLNIYINQSINQCLLLIGARNNPALSWSKSDLVVGAQPRAHHGISEECHFAIFLWERTTSPFLKKRGRPSLKRNLRDTDLPSYCFSLDVLSNKTSSCPTCSQLLTVWKNPCWPRPQP